MAKLWKYEDYVDALSHENSLVRRWAFDALEKRYPNTYTDEVSTLISDEDSHLACAAPKYLARHRAVQHADKILNSFLNDSGDIPSNCALALAKMEYEPALERMLESFSNDLSAESLFGIFNYWGSIRSEIARETLISATAQISDPMLQSDAFLNLLKHKEPEDLALILDIILKPIEKGEDVDNTLLEAVSTYWEAGSYYSDLLRNTGRENILDDPEDVFDSFFKQNDHLSVSPDVWDELISTISGKQYQDLVTFLMFEAKNMINKTYPEDGQSGDARKLYDQDVMGVALFREFSGHPSLWHNIKGSEKLRINGLIGFVLSVFFSIVERHAYVRALLPDAQITDLIDALQHSGPNLPEALCRKIVDLAPVSALKTSLSQELNTWSDIGIVKIMGRIGSKEFLPDLIRVLNDADFMDYIYGDALTAINALDESADELILAAVQNNEIKDWELFSTLEHLPYSESFDLIVEKWEDENSEIDSYEMFASCLEGIGDARGIEILQDIYNDDNNASYIGSSLECLSLLHNVDIPELSEIRERRQEEKKQREIRKKEFDNIFCDMDQMKNKGTVLPFKRKTKKVGRNEPCPCGSGKKYKKCCLNKS